jgi:hypothetical protein
VKNKVSRKPLASPAADYRLLILKAAGCAPESAQGLFKRPLDDAACTIAIGQVVAQGTYHFSYARRGKGNQRGAACGWQFVPSIESQDKIKTAKTTIMIYGCPLPIRDHKKTNQRSQIGNRKSLFGS